VLINADISWGEVDDNQLAEYWRHHVGNWDDPRQRERLRQWSDYEQRVDAIGAQEQRPRPRKAFLSMAMGDRRVEPHNSTRWAALRQHEEQLFDLGKDSLTLVKGEGGGHAGKSLKELGGRDAYIKSFLGNTLGARADRLPTTSI
jgi:prolyl oligopeptidase PreP (S9A serine peptidase family)